jgi:hypothetical protein
MRQITLLVSRALGAAVIMIIPAASAQATNGVAWTPDMVFNVAPVLEANVLNQGPTPVAGCVFQAGTSVATVPTIQQNHIISVQQTVTGLTTVPIVFCPFSAVTDPSNVVVSFNLQFPPSTPTGPITTIPLQISAGNVEEFNANYMPTGHPQIQFLHALPIAERSHSFSLETGPVRFPAVSGTTGEALFGSDDFDTTTLNTSLWAFVNPVGNGSFFVVSTPPGEVGTRTTTFSAGVYNVKVSSNSPISVNLSILNLTSAGTSLTQFPNRVFIPSR